MVDTQNGIPKWMKEVAYDIWGNYCQICGKSEVDNTPLHHCWYDGQDPYADTKAFQLIPLCKGVNGCHQKVENGKGKPIQQLVVWMVNRQAQTIEKGIEEYFEERFDPTVVQELDVWNELVEFFESRYG